MCVGSREAAQSRDLLDSEPWGISKRKNNTEAISKCLGFRPLLLAMTKISYDTKPAYAGRTEMEQALCNVLHREGGTVADPKNLQGQESFSLALYWLVLGASMRWPGLP